MSDDGDKRGDAAKLDSAMARLQARLGALGLLRADGTTIYGQPALRRVEAGHEPQALMDSGAEQRQLVAYAHAVPATGDDLCASWVELVFAYLGYGLPVGDAADVCRECCHYTDAADLRVGMVIAVATEPYSVAGRAHGHVGLYVGDGQVMDCVGGRVRTVPLELWLSAYGVMCEPRWGWLAGIGLDQL